MKRYGLIGYPLTHSFSKKFFTAKFTLEGSDEVYENYEISSVSLLPEIVRSQPGLVGLNVTIPYKEKVIPFLDILEECSAEVGAVNTVRIIRADTGIILQGFNTDIYGFETSLKPMLKDHHRKALILGTGGASKAVRFVLKRLGIQFLSVSIEELKENEISYSQVTGEVISEHHVIINATPLGTYPQTETFPDIPYETITGKHLLYDLVYNPPLTAFLRKGKERGAFIKNGQEMLELQALKSYSIWNNPA